MNNGFLKVAAAIPQLFPGGVYQNSQNIKKLIMDLNALSVDIAVFPEMCLYGASQNSLAAQNTLIIECEEALLDIAQFTKNRQVLCVIGLPLRIEEKILNCAAVVGMGKIWGIVYKSDYKLNFDQITMGDYSIPFGDKALLRGDTELPINISIIIGKDINSIYNSSANIILNPFSADLVQFDNYFELIKALSSSPPKAVISVCGTLCKTPYSNKNSLIAECGRILAFGNQPVVEAEIDIERITGLRTLSDQSMSFVENSFIELPIEKSPKFVIKRKYPRQPYADSDNMEHIYDRLVQILYELYSSSKKRLALYKDQHFWTLFSMLLDLRERFSLKNDFAVIVLDEPPKDDIVLKSRFDIEILNIDAKSQNIKNAYILDYAEKNNLLVLGNADRTDYIRHKLNYGNFINPLINFNKTAIFFMLSQRRKYDDDWAEILEKYQPSLDDIIIDFFIYHYIDCGISSRKTKQIALETFEDIKKIEDLWDEFVISV